jgi:protein-S-isoprenylcysteine O-methyltransferase Ste14
MLNNKIPPVIVLFFFAALMALIARYSVINLNELVFYSSLACVAIGVIFGVAGVVSFRLAKTTVNPHKVDSASKLVTSGIFKITRNPMYVGLAFLLVGWGIWLSSFWALLCVVGFIAYLTLFQIKPEERALSKLFSEEYNDYKARVRRWL